LAVAPDSDVAALLMKAITVSLTDRNVSTVPQLFDFHASGDALPCRHFFPFFAHPELYILILRLLGRIPQPVPIPLEVIYAII